MNAHLQKLNGIKSNITQYTENVKARVQEIREETFQKMLLIKNSIQHLDKVLQIETRKRKEQIENIPIMYQKILSEKMQDFKQKYDELDQELIKNNNELLQSYKVDNEDTLQDLKTTFQKHQDEWKNATTLSTQKVKVMLDEARAKYINEFTTIYNESNEKMVHYPIALQKYLIECERTLSNAIVLGQNKNKEYEGENINFKQQFLSEQDRLKKIQDAETNSRTEKLNQLVQTLAQSIEMIQTNMDKMSHFLEK